MPRHTAVAARTADIPSSALRHANKTALPEHLCADALTSAPLADDPAIGKPHVGAADGAGSRSSPTPSSDAVASQKHPAAVLAFSGGLGELAKLCCKVCSGTTIDLGEACIKEGSASMKVRALRRPVLCPLSVAAQRAPSKWLCVSVGI